MNQTTIHKGFRFSFVTLVVSLAALVVSYVSVAVLGMWRGREQAPHLAVDSLVKTLINYHKRTGRFPKDFWELETRVWKHKAAPDFGADGRNFFMANYFYIYYPVDVSSATIWIIPTGPRREAGSTHFLILRPDSLRRWKGSPLSLDDIKNLPPVPQYGQMSLLGMAEQRPIALTNRR